MAITRAQQYRQMLKDGSKKPVKQAGVMNYMPSEMVTVPKIAKSSPDTPTAKLAYITPEEQDVLIDLNLYGSLDGKPNRGPGGIPSLEGDFGSPTGQGYGDNAGSYGEAGADVSGRKDQGTGNYQVTNQKVQDEYDKNRRAREADAKQKEIEEKFKADAKRTRKEMRNKVLADKKIRKERISNILSKNKNYLDPRTGQIVDLSNYGVTGTELEDLKSLGIDPNKAGPMTDIQQDIFDQMMEKNDRFSGVNLENFQNKFDLPTTGITSLDLVTGLLEGPLSKGSKINKEFFTDDVLGAGKYKYDGNVVNPEIFSMLNPTEMQDIYGDYMGKRMSGETDAYGNPTNLNTGGGGGDNNQTYVPPIIPEDDTTEEEVVPPRNLGGLAPRFAGSIFDFTGLADGGIARAGAMDGGRMMQMDMMNEEDDPVGGIMDLETGRQQYFLGKLVKKATRAVKKIAKSPIGKAALLYAGGSYLGGANNFFGGLKGSGILKSMGSGAGKGSIFSKLFGANNTMPGFANISTAKMPGFLSKIGLTQGYGSMMPTALGGVLGASTLAGLMTPKEKEENNDDYYEKNKLNIANIRNNPYKFMAPRFAADGGIMRNGYAEGSEEPVAKKTMPLLDMDGQEMDLREEGGFVPLGRMERADDVPARLSKNEFVFTADAVRNAGEGDVDKGAEVMYNMMKNLESGGEVSQESQGLEGAREMFQTSKRLEEVI
ncbi:hypothetical protein OAV76_03980 [Schleiferiaceae bacterium]|nr:hypothetical protein [Schleiferiaceae bacterium]